MKDTVVGKTVGIWTVNYICPNRANDGHLLYHVTCNECGFKTDMLKSQFHDAKKCTHLNKAGNYKKFQTYKWSNLKIADIFNGMLNRCYNSEDKSYRWYGAKGIKVCTEWINTPKLFEEWALQNGYKDSLTIDRIDENKDYCPENCRWITLEKNSAYKSTTKCITINDETYSGREWAMRLGVGLNTINRFRHEYGEEKVIEFIKIRLQDLQNSNPKVNPNRQNWLKIYNLI